jgi:hypothetical protein
VKILVISFYELYRRLLGEQPSWYRTSWRCQVFFFAKTEQNHDALKITAKSEHQSKHRKYLRLHPALLYYKFQFICNKWEKWKIGPFGKSRKVFWHIRKGPKGFLESKRTSFRTKTQ